MNIFAVRTWPRQRLSLVFVLGLTLLLGTWLVLYWTEALFTESHLVGYYCCVTEQDLPAMGTLARISSDFFRILPGKHLPSLLFIAINVGLFARALRKRRDKTLPWLFVSFSVLYYILDWWLVNLSWSISNQRLGPLTSAYKGYHRTWYGIVLHFVLWGVLFLVQARVSQAATKRAD